MPENLQLLWEDDKAQDLAEYAILLVLVAVIIVTGMRSFRSEIANAFSRAAKSFGAKETCCD